jgi:hypothetical protein
VVCSKATNVKNSTMNYLSTPSRRFGTLKESSVLIVEKGTFLPPHWLMQLSTRRGVSRPR